jgi:hypothetical protein
MLQIEREEKQLEDDLEMGLISMEEFNFYMKELQLAENAYYDEMSRW